MVTTTATTWRFRIPDGTLEAVKWLALVSMVWDHGVRFLLYGLSGASSYGPATAFGRLAFPLFALILAYNLARPGMDRAAYRRTLLRLLGFGLLAVPAYWYLIGPYPLNILFTLALATLIVAAYEARPDWRGALGGALLFVSGGALVEYGWPGLTLILSAYAWFRSGATLWSTVLLAAGFLALADINWSHWGTLALPVFLLASAVSLRVPRNKWFFYAFYPIHLTLIAAMLFLAG